MKDHVHIYAYQDHSVLTNWQYKLWENLSIEGQSLAGNSVWWEFEMEKPQIQAPLFLYPEGMSKGQAYLNGKAAGRFWEIGPQKYLYLPEPWWNTQNKLVIFDEKGRSPEAAFLKRDSYAPNKMVEI